MDFETSTINKNSLEKIADFFSLQEVNVLHFLNENKTRLYINGVKDYTIYLEELEDQVIFCRVWREWEEKNPITKQEEKDLVKCKAIKWKILKLLHSLNDKKFGGAIYLEEMPEKMEDTRLDPKGKQGKSLLDLQIEDEWR